jgi:glycerophosphoryl diester phosphodiesterase
MKRKLIAVTVLTAVIIFAPFGNDVNVNVDVELKHPVKTQTKATMAQKHDNKVMAMRYAKAGWNWNKEQRRCIYSLFMKESRFDHLAKNQQGSSAYGIGQVLKETSKDPAIQILNAYKYIEHRYGTPCKAWKHSQRRNWY